MDEGKLRDANIVADRHNRADQELRILSFEKLGRSCSAWDCDAVRAGRAGGRLDLAVHR
ncbi:hypothetical protein BOSEA31B_20271 [Hyphomicrobiales bacterium]|nr:hypothetical protein BOSEA31B_20271 [Hyphomicrobiales bacterium]CAH1702355.1 hypothetical protein BOSEA1005_30227 [Hyphomicrobiales bacterium]CAI0346556.1 hypothetical protein BO1005MUT1_520068 [Hyphomicrobiales bacterium]